ncbi:BlaI/MecI/CopY family transcriptional regulator [Gaopeijia maritima]|uniref:BlaI/MecI/CopY family transcriptional regulator n=1 Tax=Gaopeijia maritima TaxID=3119007 RepID=A0ABU9EDF2_9BACT
MSDTVTLTELQIDLLDVLWERGEASTSQVCEAIEPTRGLALSTVATLLSRLEKKKVVAHRKEGRQYVYWATVSRGDVRRSMVRDLTRSLFGGDPAALVQHLVAAHEVDGGELDRIRALLDEADARQE